MVSVAHGFESILVCEFLKELKKVFTIVTSNEPHESLILA